MKRHRRSRSTFGGERSGQAGAQLSDRVLVTGASGKLGQAVVEELLARGYDVVGADRRPSPVQRPKVRVLETDLGDVGEVAAAMSGARAVIHLGAIPGPNRHADEVVFGNNTRATFAVLQAARLLGVRKAVIASSISALGPSFSPEPSTPLYAPVDEDHPLLGADPYALSKEVGERTAAMFHRRAGIAIAALRFTFIGRRDELAESALRIQQNPGSGTRTLWSYVDIRDAATATRLALEADGLTFEVFNVAAADTLSDVPTEELLRDFAPLVEVRQPIPGRASAYSIAKARRLLGYEPAHSWRGESAPA
jgi:nucleoside-diphosphate-sugar epimerase